MNFIAQSALLTILSFCSSFIWCVVLNVYYSEVRKIELPPQVTRTAFWFGGLGTSAALVLCEAVKEFGALCS